jgi:hypothetical protein
VKSLCREKGLRLGEVLAEAEVSRTAYYHLVHKDSVLPKSVRSLAHALGVPPSRLLETDDSALHRAQALIARVDAIVAAHPTADRDNVRHTLVLLDEPPIDRLNRGLLRGRAVAVH